jgi:ABC-type antimicrobial peptide transport system permease subunit
MALGAGRWQVVRLTTTQAVRITLAGIAVGGAMAFGIGRLMQSLLFGTVSTNLWLLAALMLLLALAALVAAYLPARRAVNIDPMTALRES